MTAPTRKPSIDPGLIIWPAILLTILAVAVWPPFWFVVMAAGILYAWIEE